MLDSAACFRSRAEEIGLTEDEISRAGTLNVNTFGKFAFGANYVPGQANDQPLLAFISKLCDEDPPPESRIPLIRRLFYEAYTLQNAELRAKIEKREDDPPRRLAQAERSSRYEEQAKRLAGLDLTGELEPSHALVDVIFQMIEDNQMRYIRWEQCTKRDQELMGIKHDPMWKPDSQGIIREVRVQSEIKADTSSDLRLKYALQRRSLAVDQGRLCSYDKLEKWSNILLEAYTKTPLEGYKKVTIEQIQHADMEMFKYLIKKTRGGIRPTGAVAPLAAALDQALVLPEIRLHLQPLPAGTSAKRKSDDDDEHQAVDKKPKSSSSSSSENMKLRRTIENLQGQVRNLSGNKAKGLGKGKQRKGANPHSSVRMPAELIGHHAMTGDGEPICFSFNLSGCDAAGVNERCKKGWHVCTKCRGGHSQRNHSAGKA
eukprot:s3380_g4.t1